MEEHEKEIQEIYHLMRRKALSKEEWIERMTNLSKKNVDASCFVVWLLLRSIPPSPEKHLHLEQLAHRLRLLK